MWVGFINLIECGKYHRDHLQCIQCYMIYPRREPVCTRIPMAMYDLQHVVLLLEYALYTCAQLVDAREWNFKVKAFSDLIDCRVKNIMKFIMVMKECITLQSLVNHNVWSVYCQISSIWKFFGSGFFFYFCLIWRRISKQYFFFM